LLLTTFFVFFYYSFVHLYYVSLFSDSVFTYSFNSLYFSCFFSFTHFITGYCHVYLLM